MLKLTLPLFLFLDKLKHQAYNINTIDSRVADGEFSVLTLTKYVAWIGNDRDGK